MAGAGDERAIDPAVVAEITNQCGEVLNDINNVFGDIQTGVLSKIQDSWYNENALKVMPDATKNLSKCNLACNESLSSLGQALGGATNTWSEANGGNYFCNQIVSNAKQMVCNVADSKNGFKGMDVGEIQQALTLLQTAQANLLAKLAKLKAAGEREGFRGGTMQASLNNVCDTLTNQIKTSFNNITENIATNTGIAKSNVENATSATESFFTIK